MPRISDWLAPAAAALLTVAPLGNLALLIALFALADLGIVVLVARLIRRLRRADEAAVVSLDRGAPLALRRRTEPALWARRPAGVVEMQVRWRQAAEAHRNRARS